MGISKLCLPSQPFRYFFNRRQDTFAPLKGEHPSLVGFLKTVPAKADIRVCPENYQSFPVDLPKDAAKLQGFTGRLKGLLTSKRRQYFITNEYKNGLAVMTWKVPIQKPPGK